jgi:hypothetical protein
MKCCTCVMCTIEIDIGRFKHEAGARGACSGQTLCCLLHQGGEVEELGNPRGTPVGPTFPFPHRGASCILASSPPRPPSTLFNALAASSASRIAEHEALRQRGAKTKFAALSKACAGVAYGTVCICVCAFRLLSLSHRGRADLLFCRLVTPVVMVRPLLCLAHALFAHLSSVHFQAGRSLYDRFSSIAGQLESITETWRRRVDALEAIQVGAGAAVCSRPDSPPPIP